MPADNFSSRMRRARARRVASLSLLLAAAFATGCAAKKVAAERYELKGKVVSVAREKEEVTVAHETIPNFMEAMTMPFSLPDAEALKVVEAGDQIQATLVIGTDGSAWLENPIITKGLPGDTSATSGGERGARPGDELPDLSLVNQDGRRVRLRDYKGRALLVNFIYTRCPLPDYCPMLSTKFAEVNKALESNAELRPKTHLLSVSVDPAYDTPKVLRSYGAGYTEKFEDERFEHWEFLTGTADEVKRVAEFFGLEYYPEKEQIIHTLRTSLVAPDGRVHKTYRGNDWQPADVLRDVEALLAHGSTGGATGR
ncbi:MAG TPA: SCO family protein [Pyrinomonadaceae bacterium]|nr:SCO family protein [Pyrinomonadaceae bacterium]